jgi:hypothetical protein
MPRTRDDLKVRGRATPGSLKSAPQVANALEPRTQMTREAVRVSIPACSRAERDQST